jgi:hypothetical protein
MSCTATALLAVQLMMGSPRQAQVTAAPTASNMASELTGSQSLAASAEADSQPAATFAAARPTSTPLVTAPQSPQALGPTTRAASTPTVAVPTLAELTNPDSAAQATSTPSITRAAVAARGLGARLRAEPSVRAQIIAVLADETAVELLGDASLDGQRAWRRVQAPGGLSGWIDAELLHQER